MNYVNALLFSLILCSCGTVAPKPVDSNAISFSGNNQTAGIVSNHYDKDGKFDGFLVEQKYVDDYNFLIICYGNMIKHPTKKDEGLTDLSGGYYVIDKEHAQRKEEMAGLRRREIDPEGGWVSVIKRLGL